MTGTTGWKRCLGAVVCVLVMAVGGCGSLNPFAPVGTPSPSLAPTYDPDRPTPKAPKGYTWAPADSAGVVVPVPKGWKVVPAETLLASSNPKVVAEAAKRVGMDPAAFQQAMRELDVMAVGPAGKSGAPTVGVQSGPVAELPSEAQTAKEAKAFGGTVGKARTVKTPIGSARLTSYTLPLPNGAVHGRNLLVVRKDTAILISVAHSSAKAADQVTAGVVKHLARY